MVVGVPTWKEVVAKQKSSAILKCWTVEKHKIGI